MNEETKVPHMTRHEGSHDESIKDNSAPVLRGGDNTINDRIGLFLAICAFGFALFAVGMEVNRTLAAGDMQRLQEQVIDAKIKAGVADAEAISRTAETHARVALDKVEDFRAKLAEKGINVTLDGH
jgi:hypothetical protein